MALDAYTKGVSFLYSGVPQWSNMIWSSGWCLPGCLQYFWVPSVLVDWQDGYPSCETTCSSYQYRYSCLSDT